MSTQKFVRIRGVDKVNRKLDAFVRRAQTDAERAVSRASIHCHDVLIASMNAPKVWDDFLGVLAGAGDTIVARTGQTSRRISAGGQVVRAGNKVTSSVGSPDQHMQDIETGATKRDARIPLAHAQTRGGVDRYKGREVPADAGFFVYPTKKQRAKASRPYPKDSYLARGVSGTLELWYLLKTSIRIRARHLFANAKKATEPFLLADVKARIETSVREANQ